MMLLIKVIASEGEQKAAKALKEAADVISQSPAALQLRWSVHDELSFMTMFYL